MNLDPTTMLRRVFTLVVLLLAVGAAYGQAQSQDASGNWLSHIFQPLAGSPVPGANNETPWSGQSGASGNPLMTADAIRAAAADFDNCIAGLWPDAARRGITRANFERLTAGLTPDLRIMDL